MLLPVENASLDELTSLIAEIARQEDEDALRKELNKVKERLEAYDYHTAARLGYEDVSSEFIFLQRTMGGI